MGEGNYTVGPRNLAAGPVPTSIAHVGLSLEPREGGKGFAPWATAVGDQVAILLNLFVSHDSSTNQNTQSLNCWRGLLSGFHGL